jgi:uncharacterized protein
MWYQFCNWLWALTNTKLMPAYIIFMFLLGCSMDRGTPVEEIVRFRSGDVTLEGVLHLPTGPGKYPLAVFIHGSGRATRSDYGEFVAPLIEEGIAVFRYDKRGVGASGGIYGDVNVENSEKVFRLLASDAAAAIQHLRSDGRIMGNKVILMGGSQAGWIIPEINTITEIWLSVCISGPWVSVGEEIYYSNFAEKGSYSQEQADAMLKDFDGINGYDPISRIERMKTPSLWIFGGRDVSIPIKESIHRFESIKQSKQALFEMKLYPHSDHGLYSAGKREDYVSYIVQWIRSHR